VRIVARINRYAEGGRVRAKLYLSPEVVSALGEEGRVGLIFGGERFEASVSRASRRGRAARLYLPRRVCDGLLEGGGEGAVVEVDFGRVEILRPVRFCRICGEPTSAPDGLCMGRHYGREGVCSRCGRPIPGNGQEKSALCEGCLKIYASLCGLGGWLERSNLLV